MINSIKQERILDLILQRQFNGLSVKQENLLCGLIENEIVDKQVYQQLLNDRKKLVDYIIKQSEKLYGPFDICAQNAYTKFQNKLKSQNK